MQTHQREGLQTLEERPYALTRKSHQMNPSLKISLSLVSSELDRRCETTVGFTNVDEAIIDHMNPGLREFRRISSTQANGWRSGHENRKANSRDAGSWGSNSEGTKGHSRSVVKVVANVN